MEALWKNRLKLQTLLIFLYFDTEEQLIANKVEWKRYFDHESKVQVYLIILVFTS